MQGSVAAVNVISMKLLCFQAKRFRWKTYSKSLPDVPDQNIEEEIEETLVVFMHAEAGDWEEARKSSVARQTLKHIKWLANKRGLTNIVLHSFAHLGGNDSPPALAKASIAELTQHLGEGGYNVRTTPFGYFCEWDLSVYGDSLAKVWKEIR